MEIIDNTRKPFVTFGSLNAGHPFIVNENDHSTVYMKMHPIESRHTTYNAVALDSGLNYNIPDMRKVWRVSGAVRYQ